VRALWESEDPLWRMRYLTYSYISVMFNTCKNLRDQEKMGQLDLVEEKAALVWDNCTMWTSREWLKFQRMKLSQADNIVHCLCGEGCDKCYGEPHCGCQYCYQPPRTRKRRKKKKKLKQSIMEIIEIKLETVCVIPRLIYQNSRPASFTLVKAIASLNIIKPKLCHDTRMVRGPKKTRYFCTHCQADICNHCVSSCCSSHKIQFMGSRADFCCQSSNHCVNIGKQNM